MIELPVEISLLECLALAQRGIDSWVEIIIVVLVIGGSMFGAIAKKLIEKFTPKDSDESKENVPGARGESRPVVLRPERQRPAHPVARPLPPPAKQQPVARQRPSPPIIMEPAPPRRREHTRRPPAPHTRPARRAGPHTAASTRPEPIEEIAPLDAGVKAEEARFKTERERRMRRLESEVTQRGGLLEAEVEKRLGHVESSVAKPYEKPEAAPGSRSGWFGQQSRGQLRRAILLREILGPPISLRPPGEHF